MTHAEERIRPRVLLVEDDASVRALLTRYLEGLGFSVTAFADAASWPGDSDPHSGCRPDSPCVDIVLTDLHLEADTGIALMQRLAARACSSPVRVIMSGAWTSKDLHAANHLGVLTLQKPVNLMLMKRILWAALPTHRRPPSLRF